MIVVSHTGSCERFIFVVYLKTVEVLTRTKLFEMCVKISLFILQAKLTKQKRICNKTAQILIGRIVFLTI